MRRVTKTGEEVWLSATHLPIVDVNGKPSKVVMIAHDATASLKASSSQTANLRSRMDAFSRMQGKAVYDLGRKFKDVNGVFLDIMDYTEDELIGQPRGKLLPAEVDASGGCMA